MGQESKKPEQTFGHKIGYITGSIIACCVNALIIAVTAKIVLWII